MLMDRVVYITTAVEYNTTCGRKPHPRTAQ